MFETVSFHIVKACNMKCKFCYATFDDQNPTLLSVKDATTIIWRLRDAGMKKITFAGGEPMLYKGIEELIEFSKSLGLTTSIVTNGSLLTNEFLQRMRGRLDWIGVSIDSLNVETNQLTGRVGKEIITRNQYIALIEKIKNNKFKLKINTVVNAYNKDEDMSGFINWAAPDRWKIFQALRVEGQNDAHWDEIKVGTREFNDYVVRHLNCKNVFAEDNYLMTGSYLLIDPQGRLFENSAGIHTYSDPVHTAKHLDDCLKQIKLDRSRFIERGGIYRW